MDSQHLSFHFSLFHVRLSKNKFHFYRFTSVLIGIKCSEVQEPVHYKIFQYCFISRMFLCITACSLINPLINRQKLRPLVCWYLPSSCVLWNAEPFITVTRRTARSSHECMTQLTHYYAYCFNLSAYLFSCQNMSSMIVFINHILSLGCSAEYIRLSDKIFIPLQLEQLYFSHSQDFHYVLSCNEDFYYVSLIRGKLHRSPDLFSDLYLRRKLWTL